MCWEQVVCIVMPTLIGRGRREPWVEKDEAEWRSAPPLICYVCMGWSEEKLAIGSSLALPVYLGLALGRSRPFPHVSCRHHGLSLEPLSHPAFLPLSNCSLFTSFLGCHVPDHLPCSVSTLAYIPTAPFVALTTLKC